MLAWRQSAIVNWSMTERSSCYICQARTVDEIRQALTAARGRGLSVIAHGAGHSYTDAALNNGGLLLDLSAMRRVLAWDPARGIMRVEPGVSIGEVARVALADRWWPPVTPSTASATVGGCVAMNVNGKNAWTHGSFGEHVLSLTVLLVDGQLLTVSPTQDGELFRALVGSAGLLGIITSITLQLRRVPSDRVEVSVRPGRSLRELFQIFEDEQAADYLEAWVDGFAAGRELGRGIVTVSNHSERVTSAGPLAFRLPEQSMHRLAHWGGILCRPLVESGVRGANSIIYRGSRWPARTGPRQTPLVRATYYAPALFTGYRVLLPAGSETFQAFVPATEAGSLFAEILRRSQEHGYVPLWCIIKRHRRDPFLLSYQVDGFSLEVNYRLIPERAQGLHQLLRGLMELVIVAGGRFYLAKDSLLTHSLYRRSIGDAAVAAFLDLKLHYDPDLLLQSNLYRRVFQPSLQQHAER
ncbi:oxidoreductase [Dictyobacter sp. S3.2.2.5]|uniref:Oxidoreductase n=2 Tax=Dictyobacter halimunensis TaxID=3026934 RepID=A0ABQ6G4B7_9CHLR|nr:oxidoreductase [Dictyobacter sp. S3.2.2.5]